MEVRGRVAGASWRVGDAERERVQRVLGEHYAAGRLSGEEHDARSAAAVAARTSEDIDALLADLPRSDRLGWTDPGLRLHAGLFVAGSAALVLAWWLTRDPTPAPIDEGAGYYWPAWVVLVWAALVVVHALRAHGRLPALRLVSPPAVDAERMQEVSPPAADGEAVPSVPPTGVDPWAVLAPLSEREREVLELVAEGHANKEIARRLGISERTARTHVSNVLRKLGVDSRTQAALLAAREGIGPGASA
jgi:DNA-binding CsgD family transcriptional regulator